MVRSETALGGDVYHVVRRQNIEITGVLDGHGVRDAAGLIDRTGTPFVTSAGLTFTLGVATDSDGPVATDLALHTAAGDLDGQLVLGGTFVSVGDVNTAEGSATWIELEIAGGMGQLAWLRGHFRAQGRSFTDENGVKRSTNTYCLAAVQCVDDKCPMPPADCDPPALE